MLTKALAALFPALCGLFQRSRHTPFFLLFVRVVSDGQVLLKGCVLGQRRKHRQVE